jgi:hypothetical protein
LRRDGDFGCGFLCHDGKHLPCLLALLGAMKAV